jgi:hypothetical protein
MAVNMAVLTAACSMRADQMGDKDLNGELTQEELAERIKQQPDEEEDVREMEKYYRQLFHGEKTSASPSRASAAGAVFLPTSKVLAVQMRENVTQLIEVCAAALALRRARAAPCPRRAPHARRSWTSRAAGMASAVGALSALRRQSSRPSATRASPPCVASRLTV